MSDEFTLDLEPEPKPEPKPQREPPPALKRTSTRKRVARPQRASRSAAPETKGGKLARWLRWIVSPRFYYSLGFLLTGYAIYALYNPGWGAMARMWPHEALGIEGTFTWDLATAQLLTLIVLALALLVASFMRAGHRRGVLVAVCSGLVLVSFGTGAQPVALAGLALTGGALLAPRGARRAALLMIGLGLLAAHLFMPWAPGRFTRGIDLAPSYQATAFDTIDALAAPKPGVVEARGWPRMILERIEPLVALLLAAVGLLALVGAGGRWARWAAGVLLLLLCGGALAELYRGGAEGAEDAYQAGISAIALAWFGLAAAYVLNLGGAVADLLGAPASES